MAEREPMSPQELSLRNLRVVHLIFIVAVCLYAVAGERITHPNHPAGGFVLPIFAALSVPMILLALRVRSRLVQPARETLRNRPDDVLALARWRGGTLVSLIISEAVALLGFELRFFGFPLMTAAPFYAGAIILLLLWIPRLDVPRPGPE